MLIEEMFPTVEFTIFENENDNPRIVPFFPVPEGWWYSTSTEPDAQRAEKYLNLYMRKGFLKVVNPDTTPPEGIWYCWDTPDQENES